MCDLYFFLKVPGLLSGPADLGAQFFPLQLLRKERVYRTKLSPGLYVFHHELAGSTFWKSRVLNP
jgi:hypothetical protein